MATECIGKVGPWGRNTGRSWSFKLNGSKLTEIWISSGDCIHSITFIYEDQNGDTHQSPKYGGNGGRMRKIIFQKENEELESIAGTIGECVTSLYFTTNKRIYGPYGEEGGTHFSLPVNNGHFIGFFGDSRDLLDSIGAFIQFYK